MDEYSKNRRCVFVEEPEDFLSIFEVVSTFCEYDGKVLFLQRSAVESYPHTWGMPAGKKEQHEETKEAALRELFEETGIEVQAQKLQHFRHVYVRADGNDFVYHMFHLPLVEKPEILIDDREHQEFMWRHPKETHDIEMVPGLGECLDLFYGV